MDGNEDESVDEDNEEECLDDEVSTDTEETGSSVCSEDHQETFEEEEVEDMEDEKDDASNQDEEVEVKIEWEKVFVNESNNNESDEIQYVDAIAASGSMTESEECSISEKDIESIIDDEHERGNDSDELVCII